MSRVVDVEEVVVACVFEVAEEGCYGAGGFGGRRDGLVRGWFENGKGDGGGRG